MDKSQKLAALKAVSLAFEKRGPYIQYDQLSLDRVVRVSSRRNDFAAPEAATAQHYLFLDCSSYVWACFYQAFDYMMESDLTWHIYDYATPCVFKYEITGIETEEEKQEVMAKFRRVLEPGDTVTWKYKSGNGHIMLYLGDGKVTHCAYSGAVDKFSGYKYDENRNYVTPGGIRSFPLEDFFRETEDDSNKMYLFRAARKCIAIHRPLNQVGEPTAQTASRMTTAKNLVCRVESSCFGGACVEPGKTIDYTLFVRNDNDESVAVTVDYVPGKRSTGKFATETVEIAAGKEARLKFFAVADEDEEMVHPPVFTVNGLRVEGPAIAVGRRLAEVDAVALCENVKAALTAGTPAETAIYDAYKALGYTIQPKANWNLGRLFFLHDALSGDVLSRRPQHPETDGCVLMMFGGKGVVTPQASTDQWFRANFISAKDLLPGDIVCYADSANFAGAAELLWDGEGFVGSEENPAALMDSLFGRFVFAVARPALKGKDA